MALDRDQHLAAASREGLLHPPEMARSGLMVLIRKPVVQLRLVALAAQRQQPMRRRRRGVRQQRQQLQQLLLRSCQWRLMASERQLRRLGKRQRLLLARGLRQYKRRQRRRQRQ